MRTENKKSGSAIALPLFSVSMVFSDSTGMICFQKHGKIVDFGLQFLTLIGFGNLHAGIHPFKDEGFPLDIMVLLNGDLLSLERMMGNDAEMSGTEDQGVAGNAGSRLVSLAEATVNDDEPSVALDGAFTLFWPACRPDG